MITPQKCVEIRKTIGGPASEMVEKQIEKLDNFVEANKKAENADSQQSEWDLIFENYYK